MIFRRQDPSLTERLKELEKNPPKVEKEQLPKHPFFADVLEAYGRPIPKKNAIWRPYSYGCPQDNIRDYVYHLLIDDVCVVVKPATKRGIDETKRDVYIVRPAKRKEVESFYKLLEDNSQLSKSI